MNESHGLYALVAGVAIGVAGTLAVTALRTSAPGAVETAPNAASGIVVTRPDGTTITAPEGYALYESDMDQGATQGRTASLRGEAAAQGTRIESSGEGVIEAERGTVPSVTLAGLLSDIRSETSETVSSWRAEFGAAHVPLLLIAGVALLIAGPVGVIWGRRVGLGLSITQAAVISGLGLVLIGLGVAPEMGAQLILGAAALGVVGACVWLLGQRGAARRLTSYDELATAYWRVVDRHASRAELIDQIERDIASSPDLVRAHNDLL